MPKGDVETYFEAGAWKNRIQGNKRATNRAATQAAASTRGRAMAIGRGVGHIVKDSKGRIREFNTRPRSRDPRNTKSWSRGKDLLGRLGSRRRSQQENA